MSFSTYLLIIITTIPSHNAYKWMVNGASSAALHPVWGSLMALKWCPDSTRTEVS
jgi:hypothetical protein